MQVNCISLNNLVTAERNTLYKKNNKDPQQRRMKRVRNKQKKDLLIIICTSIKLI